MNWFEIIFKLWPVIKELLMGTGTIKNPEEEKAYQLELLRLAQEGKLGDVQEWVDFLKYTTPDPNRVAVWANTWIAVTRPAITWLVTGSIIVSFFVAGVSQRMIATVKAFGESGTAGLILLSIPLWWFMGRSVEKIYSMKFGNGVQSDADASDELIQVPPKKPVSNVPAPPFTSGTDFKKERGNEK